MSDNNKSYRLRTNVGEDSVLNVNINQDFNVLEVLSLKISTDNLYKLHTSDYGCVAGRVLANGGYGIPNAKVSIFIAAEDSDLEDSILSYLYPYKTATSKNSDKIRYNLLPEDQLSDCHRNVGTFPSKRTVLDDNNVLEIYDKYYKFTTRTNESGDYMIFGVPTGNQTLHIDIDLSDIGILSQRPRDMVYKGYNITQFENANMFKKGTDLDSLAQIISQNQSVYVYPFWGEETEGDIAITRRDIEVQYEFTPTCVFMGSLITDEGSNGISKRCIPSERMGKMDRLTTGNGTIEMIRKTPDGSTEEFIVQGNALIDGDGVWCYQIPMNLDYVRTDEFGNIVRTDDITKGIPTRASVRFRFSLTEFENEGGTTHISKVLVPNNPVYYTNKERTAAELSEEERKQTPVLDYAFGSLTDDASFKDLFSNNVYTVKSFIPRFQMLNLDRNKHFSGIKAVNDNGANNPIPYNNIRVDLTFMFTLQCAVFKVLLWVVGAYNNFMSRLYNVEQSGSITKKIKTKIQDVLKTSGRCLYIGEGYCPEMEGWYFAPKCWSDTIFNKTYKALTTSDDGSSLKSDAAVVDNKSIDFNNKDDGSTGGRLCLTRKIDYFIQCVEINLAMEYNVIQFDFYNDWINGLLYVPRWMADIRPKRTFFFGSVKSRAKINACLEGGYKSIFARRYAQQCALSYGLANDGTYTDIKTSIGCKNSKKQKCHRAKGRKTIEILSSRYNGCKPGGGIVHEEYTMQKKYAYYFRPCEWMSRGRKCNLFATDIVLLGSLEKNNTQGIPQTFEKLQPSSFQIPDTLASTNLGVDGALYGNTAFAGTICTSATDATASKLDNSAGDVEKWTAGKDVYESDTYDDKERNEIVTEASGIDWGYEGPGQGTNDKNKLYFPGGHFLGVSCFESETNIKSCVNLSRICEAGAMISQRQMLLVPVKDDTTREIIGSESKFLIPTGLISNNELNDYGFRNEFATLNYKGLKTRLNNDTLLREYDFETVYPINFDGSLKGKVNNNDAYNNGTGITGDKKITIEENSIDYYRFRLGLPLGFTIDDAKKKYLISNSSSVSLPVYENSFYFYFGLKSGSTALDKFYKNFYAECPAIKKYEPEVTITIENNASLCSDTGEVKIETKNIEAPIITIESSEEIDSGGKINQTKSGTSVTFINLPGGIVFNVTVEGNNDVSITNTFTIPLNLPESFNDLVYEVQNYTDEVEVFNDENEHCGRIIFTGDTDLFVDNADIVALAVYLNNPEFTDRSNKLYAKWLLNSNSGAEEQQSANTYLNATYNCLLSDVTDNLHSLESGITAWKGNEEYTIVIIYSCNGTLKLYDYATESITMAIGVNVIFDNYEFASYKFLIKPMFEAYGTSTSKRLKIRQQWFNALLFQEYAADVDLYNFWTAVSTQSIFLGAEGRDRLAKAIYHLRQSIFFRNSQAELSQANGSIPISIVGGDQIYDISEVVSGIGEQIVDTDDISLLDLSGSGSTRNSAKNLAESGYSMDVTEFIVPTNNIISNGQEIGEAPLTKDYFYDYYRLRNKTFYTIRVNGLEEFYLPSLYRPFFFRALYASMISGQTSYGQYYENVIANPINSNLYNYQQYNMLEETHTTADSTGKTVYKSVGYRYEMLTGTPIERNFRYFTITESSSTNSDLITSGLYDISVKEYPNEGEERNISIACHFLGDGYGYDSSVQYYPIEEAFAKKLYQYSGGTWAGATVMDQTGNTQYMNYFPPTVGACVHRDSDETDIDYYFIPHSRKNGGYLWNPFTSAMIKETYTNTKNSSSIKCFDFIRGFICKNAPSESVPNLGVFVGRNDAYCHSAPINSALIVNATIDPSTVNIDKLKEAFNYVNSSGKIGKRWGCVGIAEIPYDFSNEFGDNEDQFGVYLLNQTIKPYSFSPRHTSTITVIRLYTLDAFIRMVKNPDLRYDNPDVWR